MSPTVDKLSPLYLITDRTIAVPDLLVTLETALGAGVNFVQLREKDLPLSEFKQLAQKVLKLTRYFGAKLLLNGNAECAISIGADGVQLGVSSCSVAAARRLLGSKALIGYSAHSIQEVAAAANQGANFVTFSPVYFTVSKTQYGPPQGVNALKEICRNAPIPVYALGGIQTGRINEVLAAGASGVALISAIMTATDTANAVHSILQEISIIQHTVEESPLID